MTDETAKAILNTPPPVIEAANNISPRLQELAGKFVAHHHADLQRMARLWLLRAEILGHLHHGERSDLQDDLRAQIEALGE